jgi:hypothetical protein
MMASAAPLVREHHVIPAAGWPTNRSRHPAAGVTAPIPAGKTVRLSLNKDGKWRKADLEQPTNYHPGGRCRSKTASDDLAEGTLHYCLRGG